MVRTFLMAAVALASVSVGPRHADASEAPWCAVLTMGSDTAYWDCQYRSFEECYSKGNILAGNRGFCNPSPYYVARPALSTGNPGNVALACTEMDRNAPVAD